MKRIICKFANWLLRRCTDPMIAFGEEVYINGRSYELVQVTHKINTCCYTELTFEVRTRGD